MGKPVDGDKGGNAKGKGKGKPKGKAKASPKSKGKGGGKGKMFEVGEEETWEEVEGGHEEPSGSGDAPEGGLQMALFSFYPEDPQSEVVLSNSRVGIDCGDDETCADPHSHVCGDDEMCTDPPSHVQNSCSPLLSSTGVFGGNHENNWWLVDSGASVTVLSEQTLKQSCYEILNEETVTNGPKYFAANGTAVVMKRRVTLKAFVSLMENGQLEGCSIELTALVGGTCNNILSTSQLVEKGWKVEMSGRACTLTHEASGRYSELVSWGGCPWIFLGGSKDDCVTPQVVAGLDGIPKYPLEPVYKGVVVQKEMDELHRARGHVPYDPNCAICQRTKSVSQHRRKQNSNNVIELSADFFHYKSHKYLVICERFSGMVGCVWMSPSTDQIRRDLRRWLEEMGCLGDDGVLSVFSDDETAVGSVFTHLKVGKDIRVTKAPPQGQAMNGLAERSIRTLKEQFLTISEELKGEGVSICDTGNAIGSVFTYVCFMLNSHASVHGTQRSPTEFLVGKTISPLISSVILCELPTSLQTEDRPRFTEGCYLRPEFCSKACVAITMLDGELKVFNPKSIKLVLPLRWELTWMKGLLERNDSSKPRIKGDESVESPDVVRVGLPAAPVCPKSGPPSNWFATYKLYTKDCNVLHVLHLNLG